MKKIFTLFLCSFSAANLFSQCMLVGQTPYNSLQPGITNFRLNTINRTSGNSESASSVVVTTGQTTTLTPGQTYSISISHSEDYVTFPGDRNNLRVWLDYNNNLLFNDAGETILSVDNQPPATTYTASFTVPLSTPSGTIALRATAKMGSDAGHSLPTSCNNPSDILGYHGEMEDYKIVIPATTYTSHCLLPGRTPYSPQTPGITNVKLSNINRTSAPSESSLSVVVNTGSTATLVKGYTYSLSVTHSRDIALYPNASNSIRVWIDYNNNFVFEDVGETVMAANLKPAGTLTGTFTVPSTASVSTRRMRVLVKQGTDAGNTLPTPCDEPADPQGFRGEVEDYNVSIIDAPPNPVGLAETSEGTTVSLFPNPSSGDLTMTFNARTQENVSVELYDVTGKQVAVLLTNATVTEGASSFTWNLQDQVSAGGIYYVKTTNGTTSQYQKLILINP